jgi:aconitase B
MLKAEQAFELADASAERSAAACVLRLEERTWRNTCAPMPHCYAG